MIEILFRGKRVDNGEWTEGFYVKCRGHSYILPVYDMDHGFDERYSEWIEVESETVCQYTGLIDKNGRKIFEGDILAIPYSKKQGLPAEVRYNVLSGSYEIKRNGYKPISLMDADEWGEIVGNVFDNPEIVNKMKQELVEDGI